MNATLDDDDDDDDGDDDDDVVVVDDYIYYQGANYKKILRLSYDVIIVSYYHIVR